MIDAYINTKGRSQTNNLILHLKELYTSRNMKKQNKVNPKLVEGRK